jgi:hypothetical protein
MRTDSVDAAFDVGAFERSVLPDTFDAHTISPETHQVLLDVPTYQTYDVQSLDCIARLTIIAPIAIDLACSQFCLCVP